MKRQWGAFVCTCRGTLPIDPARLGQPAPFTYVTDDPDAGAKEFAAQAKAAGVNGVVASCCMGTQGLQDALAGVRVNGPVLDVDLKHRCFLPHPEAGPAHAKAVRMLAGAMAANLDAPTLPDHHLSVGQRVVMVLDNPAGLPLAARLESTSRLTVVVPAAKEAFGRADEHRLMWGRLSAVQGRLGALKVQVMERGENGRSTEEPRALTCDQLVWASRTVPLPVKRRTGIHLARDFSPQAIEQIATDVADLTGDFMKPQPVGYDPHVCAGGSAQREACGRCLPACPYDVISRDPANRLRIVVDHLSCEGCGACVAACPTGALQFGDPSASMIGNALAGMLSGTHGAPEAPPLVVFHCSEKGKRAIEAADSQPRPYSAQTLPVEVPCLRYTSAANILAAFRMGAGGVALLGCGECPHGEREVLHRTLAVAHGILGGFEFEEERLQLITVPGDDAEPALSALDAMAAGLKPSPIRFPGRHYHTNQPRDVIADAVDTFITQLGREPGPAQVAPDAPFAMAAVRAEGCTLCRSCTNACPTHAFRFDEATQALTFRHISCVACGLCEQVCPEKVITLTRSLTLDRAALEDRVLVQDEMVACTKCGKPNVNRKALETIEAKVASIASLGQAFAGERKALLRMCPDCRAVAAMGHVDAGWRP